MKFLRVKHYDRFQHYTSRTPIWMKLYFELAQDLEFFQLTERQRLHLISVWMLAVRTGNRGPVTWVQKYNLADKPVDLQPLLASGWVSVHDDTGADIDASDLASTADSNGANPHADEKLAATIAESLDEPSRARSRPLTEKAEGRGKKKKEEKPTVSPRAEAPPAAQSADFEVESEKDHLILRLCQLKGAGPETLAFVKEKYESSLQAAAFARAFEAASEKGAGIGYAMKVLANAAAAGKETT